MGAPLIPPVNLTGQILFWQIYFIHTYSFLLPLSWSNLWPWVGVWQGVMPWGVLLNQWTAVSEILAFSILGEIILQNLLEGREQNWTPVSHSSNQLINKTSWSFSPLFLTFSLLHSVPWVHLPNILLVSKYFCWHLFSKDSNQKVHFVESIYLSIAVPNNITCKTCNVLT